MADLLDKILGASSAGSLALSYLFYRLYRNRTETARQVRNIPVWQPDLDLYDQLSSADTHCLAYAAVEGVVKEMGRTLHSQFGNEEGVIKKSQIVEHKSKRVNGFWNDMKQTIRDSSEVVPFALVKPDGGDTKFKVEVTESNMGSPLRDELDITYDRFEPHKSSLMQIGLDRLFGEVTKGIQETERMLLTGTTVLGVGRIVLERGQMKLGPPEDSSRTYILTKMRLVELVRHFESQSSTFKILSIITAFVGGSLIAYIVWRHLKDWIEKRRLRLEFEEIRRSIAVQGPREPHVGGEDLRDEDTCVVCLANRRQIIALDCGHISMCADCAEALPLPKKCPVCRADVVRFMPVYRP